MVCSSVFLGLLSVWLAYHWVCGTWLVVCDDQVIVFHLRTYQTLLCAKLYRILTKGPKLICICEHLKSETCSLFIWCHMWSYRDNMPYLISLTHSSSCSSLHYSKQVLLKVIGEEPRATPHGREMTRPLCELAVQCPLQMSPITQLLVCYIHTTQMDTQWSHIPC